MPDEQPDDRVLMAVRMARPASRPNEESASSDTARLLLERTLAAPPPGSERRRLGGWVGRAVPAVGVLTTIAVFAVAIGLLGHGHHPAASLSGPTSEAGSGPAETLSASQYAFAVGGDDESTRVSPTQKTSGLVLISAEQILRQRCMRQRGFRYIPGRAPKTSALPSVTGYPSTFYANPLPSAYPEAALLALRQRQGFATPPNGHGDPDPVDRYLKTLSPERQKAWRTAWIGENGCYGAAEVQLFGSRHAANLEQQIPNLIYHHLNSAVYTATGAIAASHVTTANAAASWSRCMRTATGHVYTDENDLIDGLKNDHYTGPTARRVAVADTECAYSSGQAQAFAAAFRQAATHLPTAIQTPLRYLLAHRAAWVKKAQRIIVEQFNSDLTSGAPSLR